MNTFIIQRPLLSYVILSYALTWIAVLPELLSVRGYVDFHMPKHWESIGAFGPAVAAFWVAYVSQGKLGISNLIKLMTHWRVGTGWFLFVVISPFMFFLFAALVVYLQQGEFPNIGSLATSNLATTVGLIDLVLFGSIIQSLGEEPGWRGFFTPMLRTRYGSLKATMILAPIWIFWHLPFFLCRPEFGLPQFLGLGTGLFSAAVWLAFIYDKTRSGLMAFLFHTLINVTRGMALAISQSMFLAIAAPVILGAIVIIIYWLITKPGKLSD